MAFTLNRIPELDLSNIYTVSDLISPLNFAEGNGLANLPENPTAEQLRRATPLILQYAIEQNFDTYSFDARENGEDIGNIIDPIDMSKVRMIKPGYYQGEFTADGDRYKFSLKTEGEKSTVDFSPIN
jgi:hypothetical protein